MQEQCLLPVERQQQKLATPLGCAENASHKPVGELFGQRPAQVRSANMGFYDAAVFQCWQQRQPNSLHLRQFRHVDASSSDSRICG